MRDRRRRLCSASKRIAGALPGLHAAGSHHAHLRRTGALRHSHWRGAISCDGTWGTLTGFDTAGTTIGAIDLHLIDPADCSPADNPDNVTFGATGTLTSSAVIARAVLTPMSLLEFPVFNLTGHASQTYTVTVSGDAPPHLTVTCPAEVTRGTDIDCAISISDSTLPFTITDLSARVITRSAEIFETLHLPMPGTIPAGHVYHLRGPAVTATMLTVSASVTADGQPIMLGGQAQFRVDPRPMEHEPYIMQLRPQISGPGGTTVYPRLGAATFGLYQSRSPDWNDMITPAIK